MISSKTKLFCLLGNPIEHSLSPQMYNTIFEKLNLNFLYLPFEVDENDLFTAVTRIRSLGISGGNVTLPYKTAVMKYLDECDEISESIGAVNTFVNENGTLKGFNTDGEGALKALQENDVTIKNKKIVVIGAGGATKAVTYVVAKNKPKNITILNRTLEHAQLIIDKLNEKFGDISKALKLNSENLRLIKSADILVNCSSVGMWPNVNDTPVPKKFLHKNLAIMDIIYNPLETKLLKDSKEKGAKTISGIDMFINQGALAFEIWAGKKAPVKLMRKIALEALKR